MVSYPGVVHRLATVFALVVLGACSGGGDASSDATTTVPATETDTDTDTDTETDETDETATETATESDTDEIAADTTITSTTVVTRFEPEPTPLPGLVNSEAGELDNDGDVITGVLDNGLTYYVRENGSPLERTSLRLAIRAGAVDEFGDSTGVAHFVEHMLFNGTEAYPENDLIDVLQGFGADFGPHINAYTAFDETVYMLTVPSEREPVQAALDVMKEWLSHATITDDQVERERGVMLDEWRVRNESLSGRRTEHTFDMFLGHTPYGERWVGGDEASIEDVSPDELRSYYEAYYRPDNAAIVVVGDIDVAAAVDWIADAFGATPVADDELRPVVDYTFDLDTDPQIGIHPDPDEDVAAIEVTLPVPTHDGSTVESLRLSIIDEMTQQIFRQRLEGDLFDGTAPFDQMWPTSNDWVEQLDATAIWVESDPAEAAASLEAVLLELRRAFEHGFHEAEVDTARLGMIARFDNEYAGRDTVRDDTWADDLVRHFLSGSSYPNLDTAYPVAIAEANAVDAAAIHERFRARYSNSAPHVLVFGPDDAADQLPTTEDVMRLIIEASRATTEQRPEPDDLPDQLMDEPEAAPAVAERFVRSRGDSRYDSTEFTYANGARLRVIPNDQNAGLVVINAASIGGLARVPDDDVVDASYAPDIALNSGVGGFNQGEVDAILADTDFDVWAWSSFYSDHVYAETTTGVLTDTFQYLHLLMSRPRFDQVALDQTVAAGQGIVDDPSIDPAAARFELLAELRYEGEPRFTTIPTPAAFATLDAEGAARVWADRFGDASDWLFVMYGDVELAEAEALGERYLGTLPGGDGEGDPLVAPPTPLDGIREGTVEAGEGRTAATTLYFSTPVGQITAQLRAEADLARQVVSARLVDVVREEFGETYSPSVGVWFTNEPTPYIEANVDITTAPDGVERVRQLVLDELADLAANGPTAAEFDLARSVVAEQYGWKGPFDITNDLLEAELFDGVTLDDYLVTRPRYSDWPLTTSTVRDFVAAHLPVDRFVNAVSVPR